ncbi:MAG: MarR family winged helix-turn-helix transcriptional regulator [Nocardioides sp.]
MSQENLERLCGELVVYSGRLVRAVSRRTSSDVPAAALRLLSQVDELAPVTVGALAQSDRCSQPTMSAAVQNLVDKGWAGKDPNPADARSSLVSLTDEGRTVLGAARRRNAQVVAARLHHDPVHDEQDLATAVALIRGLLDQNEQEEGTP